MLPRSSLHCSYSSVLCQLVSRFLNNNQATYFVHAETEILTIPALRVPRQKARPGSGVPREALVTMVKLKRRHLKGAAAQLRQRAKRLRETTKVQRVFQQGVVHLRKRWRVVAPNHGKVRHLIATRSRSNNSYRIFWVVQCIYCNMSLYHRGRCVTE